MRHLILILLYILFIHGAALAQSTPKTYHSDRTTAHAGSTLIIGNYGTAGVKIKGTGTFEITFQVLSYNTQTWDDVRCRNVTDASESTTALADSSWQCPVAGFGEFRANLTTCTGCSVTVTGYGTQAARGGSSGGGSGVATSIAGSDTLPAEPCTINQVYGEITNDVSTPSFCANGAWIPFNTGGIPSIQQASDVGRVIGNATSTATSTDIGSIADGEFVSIYRDATLGPRVTCKMPAGIDKCNKGFTVHDGFNFIIGDQNGNLLTNWEPNALTSYEQWALGAKKILAAWDVPLEVHSGVATIALAQPVAGEAKKYWGTLTDSASDAFSASFTATKAMEGATSATVRLVGMSTDASPANDVQLECSLVSARPGTDTTTSHSTSNKQTITLTPAVQNRRVSAVSSAITINGTVAANAIIDLVCNVNAVGTTSTQLANFFLLGTAHVQWLKSSMSN